MGYTGRSESSASKKIEYPRLVPAAGVRARYWLLWVTELPSTDRGFRVGVEELRLVRAG